MIKTHSLFQVRVLQICSFARRCHCFCCLAFLVATLINVVSDPNQNTALGFPRKTSQRYVSWAGLVFSGAHAFSHALSALQRSPTLLG
jgi:hypothetical protein